MNQAGDSQKRQEKSLEYALPEGEAKIGYVLRSWRYMRPHNERFPTLAAAIQDAAAGEELGTISAQGIMRLRDGKVFEGKSFARLLTRYMKWSPV